MKKSITIIALLLTVFLSAANAADDNILVVQMRDGTRDVYQLVSKPKLVYEGSQVVVKSGNTETRYERSAVRNLNFGENSTGVTSITKRTFCFTVTDDAVMINGADAGGTVSVYGVSGCLIETAKVSADGTVRISLDTRPAGVYLINIYGYKTIKVTKR